MPWKRLMPAILLVLAASSVRTPAVAETTGSDPGGDAAQTVVYLVRHAEKAYAGADPPLSETGRRRAIALADRLAPVGIDRILSTDYRRTRDTVAPLADRIGVAIELYEPARMEELAEALRSGPGGTVLVVGHSNTTPALVSLLGGVPGDPIAEDEYDRLYEVELPSGRTTLERFEVVDVPME